MLSRRPPSTPRRHCHRDAFPAQVLEQLVQRQQAGAQAGGGGEDADFRMWDDQWQDSACPTLARPPRIPPHSCA